MESEKVSKAHDLVFSTLTSKKLLESRLLLLPARFSKRHEQSCVMDLELGNVCAVGGPGCMCPTQA